MNALVKKRREIETNLRTAIEKKHFQLFYQPQFSADTEEMVGAEALLRWIGPDQLIINPIDFIPIAEQYGLITEITNQVTEIAVKQILFWNSTMENIVPVSINIPGNLFKFDYIKDMIDNKIIGKGLDPKLIEIEITETTMINDFSESKQIFDYCDQLGIHVSIDDFGTGYSSLSYLKKLLTRKIKIDKAFIDNISTSEIDYVICKAIIDMSHSLGRKVVAEGVETKEQLILLQQMGCDIIQGFYYSKPLNTDMFSDKLTENKITEK
jgi:EAL domain-containing protein (putative c-di-GMP-specific phosphodiesterase class I)